MTIAVRSVTLFICALSILRAQTFGEFTGTITDASGAVVAAAAVKVSHAATNQVRQVTSNESGNFTVPFLAPGIYDITVEKEGFKTATRKGVDLQVGAVARLNFTLEIGAVTQVLEVTGGAPLLETENAAMGTVVENKRIAEMPLNGRNYLQLVALSPNVTHEMGGAGRAGQRQGGDRVDQPLSVAGQRQLLNRFTLDGMENTDVSNNTFIIRPSIDALQEFKVQTGVYSAEYGRETAQINVTTKSGSNEFHGAAFEFLRNDKFDARAWRQQGDKNPFRRNQFGFVLGGRLIRNKLFFLSNFEALRDRKTLQGLANVATDQMRAGDFSGQPRQIFDPLSRVFRTDAAGNRQAISATPFPGNSIPQMRFDSIAVKLLQFYPRATVPGSNILSNYVRQRPRPISWEQFTQRLDFNQNAKSSWFGRFSWGDEYVGTIYDFAVQDGRVTTKTYQAMISNTYIVSPALVNEARFGYNQFQNDLANHFSEQRDVTSELGIIGLPVVDKSSWGTPQIGFSNGVTGFGEDPLGPFTNRDHTFQALDNVSWVHGVHSLKFGGELRRDRYNQFGNQYERGVFAFPGQATFDPANRNTTGFGFADFLLGAASTSTRALGLANTMFRSTSFALYVEDTWKITPKLTMNAGLRYENTPPYHDKYRGIMNVQMFDPGVGANGLLSGTKVPIFTRPGDGDFYEGLNFRFNDGIPTQSGDRFLGRALVARDKNDFAPRLGIAYSPSPRWTVRAGFGIFYVLDIGDVRFDMGRNLGGRSDSKADLESPNMQLNDPWRFERQLFKCTGFTGTCFGEPFVLANNARRRTPYVMQWPFNIQRQLSQNVVLEVGYLGTAGHKLERVRYYNDALNRTGPNDSSSIQQRRPWPGFGRIQLLDGTVNSNYEALSTKLQQRLAKGLTYLVGFTWSKSIDDVSSVRENPGERRPVNNYNLHLERGLSQFHTGRRLVASLLYELPFGAGKSLANRSKILDKLVGGWQTGSILTFSDGTPVNVGSISDALNIGNDGNYPNATGISPVPDNRTAGNYWNIAAFDTRNPSLAYQFGNVGRNVLLTPGVVQWDFSTLKNIRIREGHSLQVRFEAFNFLNHPNWNYPATDARTPATFGKVTTARTMREMQFGLKYVF